MLIVHNIADLPYVGSLKVPIYWKDERGGQVSGAIWAFVCHCARPEEYPEPDQAQLRLVAEYFRYYVEAPCWKDLEGVRLPLLRLRIAHIAQAENVSLAELRQWNLDCLEIGVDPL